MSFNIYKYKLYITHIFSDYIVGWLTSDKSNGNQCLHLLLAHPKWSQKYISIAVRSLVAHFHQMSDPEILRENTIDITTHNLCMYTHWDMYVFAGSCSNVSSRRTASQEVQQALCSFSYTKFGGKHRTRCKYFIGMTCHTSDMGNV